MAKLYLWDDNLVIPEQTHDYQPDWDYATVSEFAGEVRNMLLSVMKDIESDVLPAMGIEASVVFVVESGAFNDCVGKYVNATSSCPFIGIDLSLIEREVRREDFRDEVVLTLVHELGHAYLDKRGVDEDGGNVDCEDAVETFARAYLETRSVDLSSIDARTAGVAFRE